MDVVLGMSPLQLTLAVSALYLVLYTGYSKSKRRLDMQQLWDVLTIRQSRVTGRELNKVAGLVGLTLLAISYLWGPMMWGEVVRMYASLLLVGHAIYSVGILYHWDLRALYFRNARWLAIVLGQVALSLLIIHHLLPSLGIYVHVSLPMRASVLSVALAIFHFYGMEVRPGPWQGELSIRPFAYTAFALSGAAWILLVFS